MKLKMINNIELCEGHWVVAAGNYPNSIVKGKKVKKAKRNSFLVDPDDRKRFLKWSKGSK
tara:strand:+ start:5988 stop:6167 length:180 start_codon:yes stop_codon:yes gene_type:complete